MKYNLVIKNGTLVLPHPSSLKTSPKTIRWHEEKLNIGIQDGKIAKITSSQLEGEKEISANHLLILPGVIDSQVHFREPGLTHKEDIESGSKAAALGGVTTFFDMPNCKPNTTELTTLKDKLQIAQLKSWVNYGFYVGATAENIAQLPELEKTPGCIGIKVFLGSSTGNLLLHDIHLLERLLKTTQKVVAFHCEDENRLIARKHLALESQDVRTHPIWRDEESAFLATQKIISLAKTLKRRVHILHISSKKEVELILNNSEWATGEILPQHLTLWAPECYDRLGTLVQQNPPIREKIHYEALWKGISTMNCNQSLLWVLGSDHAPHTLKEKALTYPESPSGMPGVQTLLPLMLNHVSEKRLSLHRLVELTAENPQKIFNCSNKGRLEEGRDADLIFVDLKKTISIETKFMASKCGWTPFDGQKITGWPVATFVHGQQIMQDGEVLPREKGVSLPIQPVVT